MAHRYLTKSVLIIFGIVFAVYLAFVALVWLNQRSLLYFPSHETPATSLTPWLNDGRTIGCCREAPAPRTIWLMMHGNAGQAADRDYVLPRMSSSDSLYVLEYPGYGGRPGNPSLTSINQAAEEAYRFLRARNPHIPVCVLGESMGSGPACFLASENPPPDKIVLVVPFDTLASVAAEHLPLLPARWLLRDRWNNIRALGHYAGPVDIFGARDDVIIPIYHAQALAKHIPQAQFTVIADGHNDWSASEDVKIRR